MSQLLSPIIGAVALLLAAVYTVREGRKRDRRIEEAKQVAAQVAEDARVRAEQIAVEAGAYARSQAIDTVTVDRLMEELRRLERQLQAMQEQLAARDRRLDEKDDLIDVLQRQVQAQLLTIDRMRHLLTIHDVAIPQGFLDGIQPHPSLGSSHE